MGHSLAPPYFSVPLSRKGRLGLGPHYSTYSRSVHQQPRLLLGNLREILNFKPRLRARNQHLHFHRSPGDLHT